MKTKVEFKQFEEELTQFPCLKRNKTLEYTVLFFDENCGIIVDKGKCRHAAEGEFSVDWETGESNWELVKGKVEFTIE